MDELIKQAFPSEERTVGTISNEKRYEIAKTLMATGNNRLTAELHGINQSTLAGWKSKDWWKELWAEIQAEKRLELNSKLGSLADLTIDILRDRLENGDFVLNNKTGEIVRKPVGVRDANVAMNNLLTHVRKTDELDQKADQVAGTDDILKQLAREFGNFAKKKQQVIDVEFKEVNDAVHEEREEGLQARS